MFLFILGFWCCLFFVRLFTFGAVMLRSIDPLREAINSVVDMRTIALG